MGSSGTTMTVRVTIGRFRVMEMVDEMGGKWEREKDGGKERDNYIYIYIYINICSQKIRVIVGAKKDCRATAMLLGMATGRVWDGSFPSHSHTRLCSYFSSPTQTGVGAGWLVPIPINKRINNPIPVPVPNVSSNPNWWWVDIIPKCTFFSSQNNEIMIIYQIWKNNIKVEINTTTINIFKLVVSLNDSKLMQNT